MGKRKAIDYLEIKSPRELGKLLYDQLHNKRPDMEYMQNLINCGADLSYRTEVSAILHHAAILGYIEIVRNVISYGVDPDVLDYTRATPLFSAVCRNKKDVAKFLISSGADVNIPNRYGFTALTEATMNIHRYGIDMINLLLQSGANVNAIDSNGRTPLHYAAKSGFIKEGIKVLLAAGAKKDVRDNFGCTPWDYLDSNYRHISPKLDPNYNG